MQLTLELPETLGERLKFFTHPNDLMVKLLSQYLAIETSPGQPAREPTRIREVIEQLKIFRQGNRLNGLRIKELIEEGRR